MKITYIAHSSFSVELPTATLLFDYYKGTIPAFSADKPLYVFASHSHSDHFDPVIFKLADQYPQVHFILSHDIWMTRKRHTRAGVPESCFEQATYMRAHESKEFPHMTITTLRSTDMGVAFLVECDGRKIYHAGDLHWWLWPGDTKQAANNMTANYQREIQRLATLLTQDAASLDLAFLPLDPRLEENYHLGMKYFLGMIPTTHVFPMHFWDDCGVIQRYLAEHGSVPSETDQAPRIHSVAQEGECWSL